MKYSRDSSAERLTARFNQELETMVTYHQQACLRTLFHTLHGEHYRPRELMKPRKPLLAQARTWLAQQLVSHLRQQDQRRTSYDEDDVVVIDAPYTVVTPDSPSTTKANQRTEGKSWIR